MAVIKVNCFKCDCGKTETNKGDNHHDNCTSLRYILVFGECNIFFRSLEHALTVARLLNILLANGISNILKHLHFYSAILLFLNTLSTSTTMADTANYLFNIICGHGSLKLIFMNLNIIELIVTCPPRCHKRAFFGWKWLIGDLTLLSVLHIS